MVEITQYWIRHPGTGPDGKPLLTHRPTLESIPLTAALLPLLEEVSSGLLQVSQREAGVPEEVRQVEAQQKRLDLRHDSLIRGLYRLLTALVELVEDSALKVRLIQLREYLFPEGPLATTRSYSHEAKTAREREAGLSQSDRELLARITLTVEGVLSADLSSLVTELFTKGRRLGELEEIKQKILRGAMDEQALVSERELRQRWMNLVGTLEQNLKIAGVSPEVEQAVLAPLRALEKAAEARQGRE